MAEYKEAFIGIDVAKLRNAVAVADAGRDGEIRYLGEVDASPESMRRIVMKLASKYDRLHVCYEAGPTGYGLYRQITALGHDCIVVAPSLIPKKAGDRVKTNRRDALALARLLRAGELTAVWAPDEAHEALHDLVRAREAAVEDLRRKRQSITSLMLRQGRAYPGKTTWGARHARWLQEQRFDHLAHQIVLQEMVMGVRHAKERLDRVEAAIAEFVPAWSLAPVVEALQALRGINLISAVTFMVEIGHLQRFDRAARVRTRRPPAGSARPADALDNPRAGEGATRAGATIVEGDRQRLEGLARPPSSDEGAHTVPQLAGPCHDAIGLRVHPRQARRDGGANATHYRLQAGDAPRSPAHLRHAHAPSDTGYPKGLALAWPRKPPEHRDLSEGGPNGEARSARHDLGADVQAGPAAEAAIGAENRPSNPCSVRSNRPEASGSFSSAASTGSEASGR